jgi:hypothetical protein
MQRTTIVVAAIAGLAGSATPQDCLVQEREVEISIEQVGLGTTVFSLPIDPPIAARNGTLFSFEVWQGVLRVSGGAAKTVATAELLDGGAVVGTFGPMDVNQVDSDVGAQGGFIIRTPVPILSAASAIVDEIRITWANEHVLGSPVVSSTLTGYGGHPQMRLTAWAGLFSGGRTAHGIVDFPGEAPIVFTEPGASAWRVRPLAEPVPLTHAAQIIFGSFFWGGSLPASGMIECHLVLDDGSLLVLDDARSPSTGAPLPPETGLGAVNCGLAIDAPMRGALADRSVTTLLYRAHVDSPLSLLTWEFTPGGPLQLLVGRCDWLCYADADENGELDFFDFLAFQNEFAAGHPASDCDVSGALDFFDFLCFQNAFAAGCP